MSDSTWSFKSTCFQAVRETHPYREFKSDGIEGYNGCVFKSPSHIVAKATIDSFEHAAWKYALEHRLPGITPVQHVETSNIEVGGAPIHIILRHWVDNCVQDKFDEKTMSFLDDMEKFSCMALSKSKHSATKFQSIESKYTENIFKDIIYSQRKCIDNGYVLSDLSDNNMGIVNDRLVCFDPRLHKIGEKVTFI